ncbi:MAG: hypothetical protein WC386_01775 [Candidatus Paceibacterota bacterium]|jgi:hypothetical protein
MLDIEKKKYYNDIYQKYKDLLSKTSLVAEDVADGNINAKNITPDDLKKRLEAEKELLVGIEFLSDDQLIDLSGDKSFSDQANAVLSKRKNIQ